MNFVDLDDESRYYLIIIRKTIILIFPLLSTNIVNTSFYVGRQNRKNKTQDIVGLLKIQTLPTPSFGFRNGSGNSAGISELKFVYCHG